MGLAEDKAFGPIVPIYFVRFDAEVIRIVSEPRLAPKPIDSRPCECF